jgi:hypothetical protein
MPRVNNDMISTPSSRGQEPFRIRAKVAMARRELNVTQLAAALGVSRITCSQAINHGLHNHRSGPHEAGALREAKRHGAGRGDV